MTWTNQNISFPFLNAPTKFIPLPLKSSTLIPFPTLLPIFSPLPSPLLGAPPPTMSLPKPNPNPRLLTPSPLLKQNSWSPDTLREEVWQRRKAVARRKSKSLTDEDFDELKACIELGFGFNSPESETDPRLSDTLPALGFYFAVNKSYNNTMMMSRMSSSSSLGCTTTSESDLSVSSPIGSPVTFFTPGEDPKTIKTRLRQWAQAVACSVKQ